MPFFSSSTTQMIPYQAEFKFGDKAEVTSTTEVWVTIDAAPALFILKNILPPFCVFRFNSFSVFFFSCLLFLFLKVFFFCFYFFLIVCLIDFSRSCDEAIDRLNCFFFYSRGGYEEDKGVTSGDGLERFLSPYLHVIRCGSIAIATGTPLQEELSIYAIYQQ